MTAFFGADRRAVLVSTTLLLMLVVGCAAGWAERGAANNGIRVFGAAFGSVGIPPGLSGAAATEEPCLKGHERVFDALAVSIGYGHNGKIRKITTRNPGTNMFGIRPGEDFGASTEKALTSGFRRTGAAHRFLSDLCSLTLLVDENGRVFGLTVELLD